jgi:hypothetical protein
MIESNIIRTCRITKSVMSTTYSSQLVLYLNDSKEYAVSIISDTDGLFEDMEIDFESNIGKDEAIRIFENECMNIFTGFNEFSLDEVLEHGERIEFYDSL